MSVAFKRPAIETFSDIWSRPRRPDRGHRKQAGAVPVNLGDTIVRWKPIARLKRVIVWRDRFVNSAVSIEILLMKTTGVFSTDFLMAPFIIDKLHHNGTTGPVGEPYPY